MQQALVIGRATATIKDASLCGHKLLLVQPQLADRRRPDGPPLLVVDRLGAGIGETVIITSDGRGARELLGSTKTPVRWTTVGIEDA
ncbi:MAG: EutN/CcmL family microcompartment protein [Pirellulaceae bacterium]|jgi:ethanolamine utilization protein EutN|nr:EutN/CcmL family microcompartment protein [Pirellulaceae bacterium]